VGKIVWLLVWSAHLRPSVGQMSKTIRRHLVTAHARRGGRLRHDLRCIGNQGDGIPVWMGGEGS